MEFRRTRAPRVRQRSSYLLELVRLATFRAADVRGVILASHGGMKPICLEPRHDGSPTADPGWLAGCACLPQRDRTAATEAPSRSAASLAPRHKRELASIGAAAVLSTAFALAPLVYRDTPAILVGASLRVTHAGLATPPVPTVRYFAARDRRTRWSAPAIEEGTALSRRSPGMPLLTRATARSEDAGFVLAVSAGGSIGDVPRPAGMVLSRYDRRPGGLSRLILGSGRHRVQPFPQPAGSN